MDHDIPRVKEKVSHLEEEMEETKDEIEHIDQRQDWILYLVVASLVTGLMEVSPMIMEKASLLLFGV